MSDVGRSSQLDGHFGKLAIVMVGLPATGKTFTARNLCRYMRWLGIRTRMFSVAHYRNKVVGENLTADFFDPQNKECLLKRTLIADQVLGEMVVWLEEQQGRVGILDASNTQSERRQTIHERLRQRGIELIFLECVYNQGHEVAVTEHLRELRLTCPEYATARESHVMADFQKRLDFYRPCYKPVGSVETEQLLPYILLCNGGERIVANMVGGYLRSRILYYLMNLHHGSKRILLYQLPSERLISLAEYARPVRAYLQSSQPESPGSVSVWTETSLISYSIGEVFAGHDLVTKPQLRGRDRGVIEGLDMPAEVISRHPEEYALAQRDPYYHRYPRAESYHDVAVRLENVMMELEKEPDDVLIIADLSVLQCIYAYFREIPNREIPSVDISSDALVELEARAYGIYERRIELANAQVQAGPKVFHPFAENL